ncbi:hypothetical protein TPHA_0P01160 [Tetrapisispora phaffii CBS 4417]|uniref:BHLH domain-containing protein n=1 Tax=Tetrapisispora phaffii (strain ATCC 24235 / CBS 4417 / NBRC 1672 / NRRL Y-8282 / UCD 70-5) TaxID=1071381 RepID=G8C296_TETPH|nr:hypothetical protein TPHA_0P01160 [Tetrapisispora phaffii CBS 4417]CCE66274.1 hypothetical protein TPHA_0P01160 [Tetrapisispora phaffii CBS 4417]
MSDLKLGITELDNLSEKNDGNTPKNVMKKVRKPRSKKVNKLSESQIKMNHVTSEQKRRMLVRSIYDDLVEAVPDLSAEESRSELLIYLKTVNYMNWLYKRNEVLRTQLVNKYKERGMYNKYSIPQNLIWEQKRNKNPNA